MYSKYYKDHGMKWQAIVTPDRLVSLLIRPWPGLANDWTMVNKSKVLNKCRTAYSNRQRLYIYGNPAYINAFGIIEPYQHPAGWHGLPYDEYAFNIALSLVRIS